MLVGVADQIGILPQDISQCNISPKPEILEKTSLLADNDREDEVAIWGTPKRFFSAWNRPWNISGKE